MTQEEFRVRDGKRTCYICKTHKPLSEYYKNKGQCKACFQIKNSARRKTPEARRQRAIKEAANKAANPCLRIAHTIRTRLGALAKRGFAKPGRSQETMGCTWSELEAYLSKQLPAEWTWKDFGSKFHIDHIMPLASFDLTDKDQYKQACHFTNLQILSVQDNLSKGSLLPTGKEPAFRLNQQTEASCYEIKMLCNQFKYTNLHPHPAPLPQAGPGTTRKQDRFFRSCYFRLRHDQKARFLFRNVALCAFWHSHKNKEDVTI